MQFQELLLKQCPIGRNHPLVEEPADTYYPVLVNSDNLADIC